MTAGRNAMVTESHTSLLLSPSENSTLIRLLGPRCTSLATAVVQIYMSEGPAHHRWNKRSCGVACFVKDNARRSYFIRIFDMDRQMLVFDQELYNQFRYKTPRSYFHTFEADDCQVGLNFADEDEARFFQVTVDNKLTERRLRKERRNAMKRQQSQNGSGARPPKHQQQSQVPPPPPPSVTTATVPMTSYFPPQQATSHATFRAGHGAAKFKRKTEKKKLKKEDISLPTNFQHISHVGWDPNRGFDLENVDPKLKQFFSKAGVSEKELQDKETRDFIYDFIDKHGGIEAAMQEVDKRENISSSSATPTPSYSLAPPPPAPPPRQSSMVSSSRPAAASKIPSVRAK